MNRPTDPVQLPDNVQAALLTVYHNWASMLPQSRARIAEHVAQRHATGVRAWVQARQLVGPKHQPRERAGTRDHAPVIGWREYYITPAGEIETENKIREDLPL